MTRHRLNAKHLALVLLSAALLAFQIALLQILATSQWHHFAYLVISIALLGFGAAGTILSLTRNWMLARQAALLPLLLCVCSITLAGSLAFIQSLFGGFDSLLLFVNPSETLRLAATALILMLPFTLGALVIGIIFTAETKRIGSYYFANMFGSGLGCLLGLTGLATTPLVLLPPLLSVLVLLAACLILPGQRSLRLAVLLSLACSVSFIILQPGLGLSQYKDLRRTLDLPAAKVTRQLPSSIGQLHIVEAPTLRSAPGLSLRWQKEMPTTAAVFVNGDMVGSIPTNGSDNPLRATTMALPYAMASPDRVLILGAGTGESAFLALDRGATRIIAVEPHRTMVKALSELTADRQGSVFASDKVQWQSAAPRTWLARDRQDYDLIVLPNVGSFGGNAGLFALHEQTLLTTQALNQAWQRLAPAGYLSITAWLDYPLRNPLRLLTTLVEMLDSAGVDPVEHIAAVRSWGTLTFCIKKTPLNPRELASVRNFAQQWAFDPALLPGLKAFERETFNRLQDNSVLALLDAVFDPENRARLYHDYPFRVAPTSDDRPFFSQFLRWRELAGLIDQLGQRTVPFIELGSLVAGVAAAILTVLAVLLILLPLVRLGSSGLHIKTLLYFGGLGIGYMWTELALIHRFEFYLGQPVYAAALVVAVLLIGSAIGSAVTERFEQPQPHRYATLVCVVLGIYALALGPLLHQTLAWQLPARITLSITVLTPVAFLMGMPFPFGMRALHQVKATEVSWAWGINGSLSVAGAALATIIAVEAGYSSLLLLSAGAYLLPAFSRLQTS